MKKYQEWAAREHGPRHWVITLVPAGFLFLLILPYLIGVASAGIDRWLNLPGFYAGAINLIFGILLIIGGFFLALWSIETQLTIGKGTPLPMMPTRKLIVKKPFTYCRNPMTLGTILAYLGIGVLVGSLAAIGIVLVFGLLLLCYIKLLEEKELEARFGAEYLEYKRSTPFIVPRLRRDKQ